MIDYLRPRYVSFHMYHLLESADRLNKAIETLEDIIDQCTAVLSEIEFITPLNDVRGHSEHHDHHSRRNQGVQLNPVTMARLEYLTAHLDSLKSTLSVMLQTLYAAQSVIWAR